MDDTKKAEIMTKAAKAAILASENGSASDAIQDMLEILERALEAVGEEI